MKLAINAISARVGGGRTYLKDVARELVREFDEISIDIVLAKNDISSDWPQHPRIKFIETNSSGLFTRYFFEHFALSALAREYAWDIVVFPNGVIPYNFKVTKSLVIIQNQLLWDLAYAAEFGVSYQRLRLWLLRKSTIRSLKCATKIVFVSNHTKKSAIAAAGCNLDNNSKVIYLGMDEVNTESSTHLVREGEKFFFYPSPFFPYKRHLVALRAFANFCQNELNDRDTKLVFAGPIGWAAGYNSVTKEIDQLGLNDRVILLPSLSRAIVISLYSRARAVLFPSVCEACPLILLEAIYSGNQVFCVRSGVMPEIAKDQVQYFGKDNSAELAELMRQGPNLSAKITTRPLGLEFTWQNHAREFYNLLRF